MNRCFSMLKRRSLVLTAILLLSGLVPAIGAGTPPAHAAADTIVCPPAGSLQGVDVNGFSTPFPIDWTKVANSGRKFGYAQANDGSIPDPSFNTNFPAMQGQVERGAFYFFEPTFNPQDATAQTTLFLKALLDNRFTGGDLIPAIDIEETNNVQAPIIVSELLTASQTIQTELGGVSPIIETFNNFWSDIGSPTEFTGNPLWIQSLGPCARVPFPYTTFTLWLYNFTGFVPGIPGQVDLDQTNGPTLPIYTVADQIGGLITLINSFNLDMGLQTSLDATLEAALSAVNAGNTTAACGQIGAFTQQVQAQSGIGRLTPDQAQQLLTQELFSTTRIQTALTC